MVSSVSDNSFSSLYIFSRSICLFQCLVNANYRVLICCTFHFHSGSSFFVCLFFASSVCKSLQCLISSLIQGGEGAQLFSCTVGRKEHCKQILLLCVGSGHSLWTTLGLHPLTACIFSSLPCSASRLLCRGTFQSRHWICALPRSKLFRFRFHKGTQVLHKGTDLVGHVFCALPGSSSSGDQVLGEHTVPVGWCILITYPVQATRFPGCAVRVPSQVCRVSSLGS